jgi:hypothetical protein
LVGLPSLVNGGLNISSNHLASLIGCPPFINGTFNCQRNFILSLAGGPKSVAKNCIISDNIDLGSLIGGPTHIGGEYICSNTAIRCLEGCPVDIAGSFDLSWCNALHSLIGINNTLKSLRGSIILRYTPINSSILGVFLIKGCTGIITDSNHADFHRAAMIVNRHIPKGRSGLLSCQQELIETGLSDFAQM